MKPVRLFKEEWYEQHPVDQYGGSTRPLTNKDIRDAGYHNVEFVCNRDLVKEWCAANLQEDHYLVRLVTVWFDNPADAVMFRLAMADHIGELDHE